MTVSPSELHSEDSFMLSLTSISAAVIGFTDMTYQITEPGTVEVGVELVGNLSFGINIEVDTDILSTTATGIASVTDVYIRSMLMVSVHIYRWLGFHWLTI